MGPCLQPKQQENDHRGFYLRGGNAVSGLSASMALMDSEAPVSCLGKGCLILRVSLHSKNSEWKEPEHCSKSTGRNTL